MGDVLIPRVCDTECSHKTLQVTAITMMQARIRLLAKNFNLIMEGVRGQIFCAISALHFLQGEDGMFIFFHNGTCRVARYANDPVRANIKGISLTHAQPSIT